MDTFEDISRLHWLRASVMGVNDGIISTSSLMIGMISSDCDKHYILIAGISALIAGAMSMAAGEYVSVSIERDAEIEDILTERDEIAYNWEADTDELTDLYIDKGLPEYMAEEVAKYMIDQGVTKAEKISDIGIIPYPSRSKPIIAAIASAISFMIGSIIPIIVTYLTSVQYMEESVIITTLIFLGIIGYLSAKLCNSSNRWKVIMRVIVWGAISLFLTLIIPMII